VAWPITTINKDVTWICDITTGGYDSQATEITVLLIPKTYTPPIVLGYSVLPPELDENAVAKVITMHLNLLKLFGSSLYKKPSRIPAAVAAG
jgi:hypothetical protein